MAEVEVWHLYIHHNGETGENVQKEMVGDPWSDWQGWTAVVTLDGPVVDARVLQ